MLYGPLIFISALRIKIPNTCTVQKGLKAGVSGAERKRKISWTHNHDTLLHKDVQTAIKNIYKDLSSKDLLEKCLGDNTQNNNESFNSTIWRLAQKHIHCGSKIIEITPFLAVGIFNEGFYAIKKCMTLMGIIIGAQCEFLQFQRR